VSGGERHGSSAPGAEFDAEAVALTLRGSKLARVSVATAGQVVEVRREQALVVVALVDSLRRAALHPYTEQLSLGHVGLVLVGPPPDEVLARMPERAIIATLHALDSAQALSVAVGGALERVEQRLEAEVRSRFMRRYRYEFGEIVEIARALMQERDIHRLLELILEKSRFITGADAGSIYVVEQGEHGERQLRFRHSHNESVSFPWTDFAIPVSTGSIAGAAVVTKKAINLPDVYELGGEHPFRFDRRVDEQAGYRSKSMLTMPMISADGDVIGVIQLINRKAEPERRLRSPADAEALVIPFDSQSEDMLATLASQAGVALENALLYDEIRGIFEGFVRASVQAIERRDPTTSGHSLRVSVLCRGLADAVERSDALPFRETRFSHRDLKELEYAALLHDFGKIGVREEVLVKAKKLHGHELEQVRARFAYARKALEAELLSRKIALIEAGAPRAELSRLDEELAVRGAALDEAFRQVRDANEPTVLSEGDFSRVAEIGRMTYVQPDGACAPLLTSSEVESLQVRRGSLNEREIEQIRSHVVYTHEFLTRIPWGKNFCRVPEIAGGHHEKLNGKGYPRGLRGDEIPVPTRIMTIADIYDALTARDRPYKRAVPNDRALGILELEVKDGNLDADLVRLFIEARVFDVLEQELSY
jgi:HD-GYP domain-containing protein (c-di-GMP phosphodiesterase class II)